MTLSNDKSIRGAARTGNRSDEGQEDRDRETERRCSIRLRCNFESDPFLAALTGAVPGIEEKETAAAGKRKHLATQAQ